MMSRRPTERFSDRVNNYVRYRPSYPEELITTLMRHCSLDSASLIADVGSGTGILTKQLLDRNLRVLAIEPNAEMRQCAEALLTEHERFTSVSGTAEETGLAPASVDAVVVAQAFHWFRREQALKEFRRILKPEGWLALVWNQRKSTQLFQRDYESLLGIHAPEYSRVSHRNLTDEVIASCFDPKSYRAFTFDHAQVFDLSGFLGRMKSSSYTPHEDSPEYERMRIDAEALFASYEQHGTISFEYDTQLYLGRLL
ncbi:methyltransferase domain-containing protein [Candidatus Bipolaricaulota bacterium]|nr:methyltransferase domain-containing protein [Candidatus Bipolaricaulota bacterium]